MPLISVLIPCHNAAPWLQAAVDSVRSQTHRDLEILVYDDGSTDGSGDIIRKLAVADSRKGEKLVLVTDRKDADVTRLAEWARAHGAPELAVPKKIVRVGEVPVLGTGKTDYVAIQQMVELDKAA